MTENAYIHIPFCKSKCFYCVFTSFSSLKSRDEYIFALKKEIGKFYKGEELRTLYFGGGTPSLLTVEQIKSILELFKVKEHAEITLEANPDGIDINYLKGIKDIGINRISFGSQTFNDKLLKDIGRTHCAKDIKIAVKNAKTAGFENISVDLIYGLPSQSIEDFSKDLDKVIDLEIEHVSLYGLKIDEGCVFAVKPPKDLPNADMQADMILLAIKKLKDAGFEHYEVSNFSKKSFESKHNLNYWNNNTYYGFGLSSSGYENGIRYKNEINLKKYIENPYKKLEEEKITKQQKLEEEIFLGLRKLNGINFEEINSKFNIDFEKKYKNILTKYTKYLVKNGEFYHLTESGILISNEIMSEFIEI